MYRCEVSIPMPNMDANVVYDAIGPEFLCTNDDRAKCDITKDGKNLKLDISAHDITSLRSALNSYLRYIKLSLDTLEVR